MLTERQLEQQRQRRLVKPSVNGRLRTLLPPGVDYAELYEEMLSEQEGGCAVCGALPGKQRLHMDHDPKTLKIRGLLCYSCNTKLGWYEKHKKQMKRYLRGVT